MLTFPYYARGALCHKVVVNGGEVNAADPGRSERRIFNDEDNPKTVQQPGSTAEREPGLNAGSNWWKRVDNRTTVWPITTLGPDKEWRTEVGLNTQRVIMETRHTWEQSRGDRTTLRLRDTETQNKHTENSNRHRRNPIPTPWYSFLPIVAFCWTHSSRGICVYWKKKISALRQVQWAEKCILSLS